MSTEAQRFRQSIRRRRIYLMRHGAVSYFGTNQPFRPNVVPLNEEGRRQAASTADVLAPVSFDRAIASTLTRTVETAEIVTQGRGLQIESVEALCEIRPGGVSEISADAVEKTIAGAFRNLSRESPFLGGETFGSLIDRVGAWFDEFVRDESWRSALIVAHGGVNRVLLARALGSGLESFGSIEQEPACINIIDVDASGRVLVRLMNHSPYNAVKQRIELTTMERLYVEFLGGSSEETLPDS